MTIGIIGSGAIGTAFARTLARAGIEATISNSRGPGLAAKSWSASLVPRSKQAHATKPHTPTLS